MNLKKLFLYFFISINFLPYCSYALEYEKGDIKNPVLTVADGVVSVTKKVSKTDDPLTYNVEFSIEGENVIDPILNDLYVSVIFDRSGSMLCADGTNTFLFLGYLKKTTINNQNLYCMYDNTIEIEKWNSAVNGAIDFSKYIVENIPTAKINLYTFADDVTSSEWSTDVFEENDFGYPNGSTNLHLAIDEAKSSLDSVNSNSMKYILIISDGEPDDLDSLKTSIKSVKDAGIKVYVIGYDVNTEARKILEEISSGDGYYYDADISKIGVILKDLAYGIKEKPLGVDAVLKDTLGKSFTFKDGEYVVNNENSVIYNNFDISEEKIVFDFNILLDDNIATGWYETNDVSNNGVVLEYKDALGNTKKLAFDTSSEVYWEEEKYLYTINYYKDFIDEDNFLGKVESYEKLDSIISQNDIEIDKYIISGYNSSNVLVSDYVIKKENNVINIVYTKNLYPYHVEYYKDEISRANLVAKTKEFDREYSLLLNKTAVEKDLGVNWLNLYRPVGYGDGILTEEIEIDLESNIVKVLYTKKDNLSYRIEYYFDGKIDSSKTSIMNGQLFGTNVDDLDFPSYNSYELKEVKNYPLIVTDKEEDNVIKVYYTIKEGVVLPPKTLVDDYSSYFIGLALIIFCSCIVVVKKYNCVNPLKK